MHCDVEKDFSIKNCKPEDHSRIIAVLKDWWGGRDLVFMVPRLFLQHFYNTSFIVKKQDKLVAFLIAFLSPANQNEGYIHFVGVHPGYRGLGIGEYLYNRFFRICKDHNRDIVKSCTSPVNKGSIKFHTKMGFEIMTGDSKVDGVDVTLHYNRPDDPKVRFEIRI